VKEKDPAKAKRRSKFSDLVFTRQFTAFDRQNPDSADSPFHGFFVLFWLGVVFAACRLIIANYLEHGNILGTNEIMGLMFHRDVVVLGLSDGMMCFFFTTFGFILQKLIAAGYITWNKEGWIIQSVGDILVRRFDLLIPPRFMKSSFC
jgi:sterol O-acyltransferase